MDGEFIISYDDSPDSEFVGPTLEMLEAPSGGVFTGPQASTYSSSPFITSYSQLDKQPSSPVPGIVVQKNGDTGGVGFASLVGSLSSLTKQGVSIANQYAPKPTQALIQRVPGASSIVNAPAPAAKASALPSGLLLVGGIFFGGLILMKFARD